MAVPHWEDREAHHRNSPFERVHDMTTPLPLMHGNKNRTVAHFQSTLFKNFTQRAEKPQVFLTYEDEDHSLQQRANQIDFHRRLHEWFVHYLRGVSAPDYIRAGIPFSAIKAERRRVARDRP